MGEREDYNNINDGIFDMGYVETNNKIINIPIMITIIAILTIILPGLFKLKR